MAKPGSKYARAHVVGYRSGLEVALSEQLALAGIAVHYEAVRIPYVKPPSTYTPDWLLPNGIIVESKGLFVSEDRSKHLLVKAQHPLLDLRFVFSKATTPLRKGSRTTYAAWCEKHGFKWSAVSIPEAWLKEPLNEAALAAAMKLWKKQS